MALKIPIEADTVAKRIGFALKANEALRVWHNTNFVDTLEFNKQYSAMRDVVHQELNAQKAIAVSVNIWNTKIPDHWNGNGITYPGGFNQADPFVRYEFLISLHRGMLGSGMPPTETISDTMQVAFGDILEDNTFSPTVADIEV